ncbi:hypothetical protein JMJ35_010701 [Cladonia borealis]|uniref:Uncharacterized protein n=1 Tax=Cladonia borealis TaxID=184061 RepID=A0AA39QRC7_9LECA|nr:hypothetical protein JMJ35_010701 [Cladonia borealis]
MIKTPPMSHKRKRSYEGLPEIPISNGHPTKIPTVDLNTLIQDSASTNPSTSFNTLLPWPILISESPPSSESSQASPQRFPLTKRNLQKFNRINKTMASNPSTPEGKSGKTKTTTTPTSQSPRTVRDALERNHIYIDDSAAEMRGADLIEIARAIVKGERKSALKKEQGLALKETAKKYAKSNEMTFLVNVWTKFLGAEDSRLVKTTADGDEQEINRKKKADLSVSMVHPFFVVEAKLEKPITEAENQCARGGAAMVRLKRKFDELAEGTYVEEPKKGQDEDRDDVVDQIAPKEEIPIERYRTDTKSFTFSLALTPLFAFMFVHWAEEAFSKEGTVITVNWHATPVASYSLRWVAPWIELHRDIDNVLDWGTLTRKQELRDLCKKIREREQSNKKQKT